MPEVGSIDSPADALAYCGLFAPIVAFTAICTSVLVHSDWFTFTGHALSDLGNVDRDRFWIYNLGLVAAGTLGVMFSVRLVYFFENVVSRLGAGTFLVGMFSLSLVGTFPSGVDHHVAATTAFFTLSTLGMFVVGIGESVDGDRFGYLWIAVVIAGIALATLTGEWFEGAAIPELVGAIAYSLFAIAYFVRLTDD